MPACLRGDADIVRWLLLFPESAAASGYHGSHAEDKVTMAWRQVPGFFNYADVLGEAGGGEGDCGGRVSMLSAVLIAALDAPSHLVVFFCPLTGLHLGPF